MVFLNVAMVFSSVLKAFKVVLHGSKCVCGGSKAVLVLKVLVVFYRVSRLPKGVFLVCVRVLSRYQVVKVPSSPKCCLSLMVRKVELQRPSTRGSWVRCPVVACLLACLLASLLPLLEPIIWSQLFDRFLILSNAVFECCNGVFKCFEGFSGSFAWFQVCLWGFQAVLVSKVPLFF